MRGWARIALLVIFPFSTEAAEVKEVVSDSGIKAWLMEDHHLPLIAVRAAFAGSGFAYDPEGGEGRAGMAAAMLTEGAGDLSEREFNEALEKRAIQFNTTVSEDLLEVSVETLSEHKDEAFTYLGLALAKPRFDVDAVERTRRQMQAVLVQAEQTPQYRMERAWRQLAFGKHAYAKPRLGTEDSLRRLDRFDLERYAERYLTRGNLLIAVSGDITPQELKKLLDAHFSDLPKKYKPEERVAEVALPVAGKTIAVPFDLPQTMIAFGLQGLKRSDPGYITAYVMNHILGGEGGLNSRLNRELRESRGLTYGAYTRLAPLKYGATWNGGFATRTNEADKALAVLQSALKNFAKSGPTDKEIDDAKQYLTGSFALNLDNNGDIAAFLITMQYYNLGIDYLARRNALINAVKREDVRAMAKKLIDPEKMLIVTVGKAQK